MIIIYRYSHFLNPSYTAACNQEVNDFPEICLHATNVKYISSLYSLTRAEEALVM